MSTRAVYSFATDIGEQHIYIHHDGYPEGAAMYFYGMLLQAVEVIPVKLFYYSPFDENRGGNYFNFIRANSMAEPTSDWRDHGDLEFRYELDANGKLSAFKRLTLSENPDEWRLFFHGSVVDFVQQQQALKLEWTRAVITGFEPLMTVEIPHVGTVAITRSRVLAAAEIYEQYVENLPEGHQNVSATSYAQAAANLRYAVAQQDLKGVQA